MRICAVRVKLSAAAVVAAIAMLVASVVPGLTNPAAAQPDPAFVDLGTFGGQRALSKAITSDGTVIGTAEHGDPQNPGLNIGVGFIRSPDGSVQKITSTDASWEVFGANNKGLVVGGTFKPHQPDPEIRAFVYDDRTSVAELIPRSPSDSVPHAADINDQGLVVGSTDILSDSTVFLYDTTTKTRSSAPNFPAGWSVEASDINNEGLFVGSSTPGANPAHGFAYDTTTDTLTEIPPPPGLLMDSVEAVNDHGLAVGIARHGSSGDQRAFVWNRATGQSIDLSQLAHTSYTDAKAYGINNGGEIVGCVSGLTNAQGTGVSGSFVYRPDTGRMQVMPPTSKYGGTCAKDINDSGLVAGDGLNAHAFVYDSRQGASNNSYTTALYHDFLGRAPDAAGLTGWDAWLDEGSFDRYTVATSFSTSPEWVERTVIGLYHDTLGRDPDQGGLKYWTDQIRSGHLTVAQVATQFYASPEYFQGFGHSDLRTWVTDLYHKVLGRSPDQGGLDYWVSVAADQGRAAVAGPFYQSTESRYRRVTDLYQHLLGRNPDDAGLRFWAQRILQDDDLVLAAHLAASPEYGLRADQRYP